MSAPDEPSSTGLPNIGKLSIGKSQDLTSGPIARTLLVFALPALGSNILQSIGGSINAVWVGKFLGEQALAATANANLIMFLMFSLVFGFGMATTILIGQNMGRRDVDAVRRAAGTGTTLFFSLGLIVSVLGWLCSPAILRALETPADVYPMALTYLRVMFVGLAPGLVTAFLSMSIRGCGDSMTPLMLMAPGMVLSVVLNPIFILGLGPAPRLGILGSGLATVIANLLSLFLMIAVIYKRDLPLRLRGAEFLYLKPAKELVLFIVRKGLPMGLQMIVMSGSALVMIGLVNHEGTDTLAAYGAANQIWTYIQMPAIAIGMAVSAMAAQNIGAGRWDRIDQISVAGVVVNIAMTGTLVLVAALFSHPLMALFLPPHGEAIRIADHISLIASWSFILMGATMVLSGVVRANGATIIPLFIMMVAYLPGRLGAVALMKPLIGSEAIWWSFTIGAALSLIMTAGFYFHGAWRKGALLATKEEAEEFVQSEGDPTGRVAPNG